MRFSEALREWLGKELRGRVCGSVKNHVRNWERTCVKWCGGNVGILGGIVWATEVPCVGDVLGDARSGETRNREGLCGDLPEEPADSLGEEARGTAVASIRAAENYGELGVDLCAGLGVNGWAV